MTAGPGSPAATGPTSTEAPGRRWAERASLLFDLAVAAVAYLTVAVGLLPWYSERLFDRDVFEGYYDQGIYQFRIVGPQVVLWLDRCAARRTVGPGWCRSSMGDGSCSAGSGR